MALEYDLERRIVVRQVVLRLLFGTITALLLYQAMFAELTMAERLAAAGLGSRKSMQLFIERVSSSAPFRYVVAAVYLTWLWTLFGDSAGRPVAPLGVRRRPRSRMLANTTGNLRTQLSSLEGNATKSILS